MGQMVPSLAPVRSISHSPSGVPYEVFESCQKTGNTLYTPIQIAHGRRSSAAGRVSRHFFQIPGLPSSCPPRFFAADRRILGFAQLSGHLCPVDRDCRLSVHKKSQSFSSQRKCLCLLCGNGGKLLPVQQLCGRIFPEKLRHDLGGVYASFPDSCIFLLVCQGNWLARHCDFRRDSGLSHQLHPGVRNVVCGPSLRSAPGDTDSGCPHAPAQVWKGNPSGDRTFHSRCNFSGHFDSLFFLGNTASLGYPAAQEFTPELRCTLCLHKENRHHIDKREEAGFKPPAPLFFHGKYLTIHHFFEINQLIEHDSRFLVTHTSRKAPNISTQKIFFACKKNICNIKEEIHSM